MTKNTANIIDPDDIYALMGNLLVITQQTEQLLRYLFREIGLDSAAVNKTALFKDKRTLGSLINHLRTTAELDEHFDEDLSGFLKLRNDFVHNLANEKWFNLRKEYGAKRAVAWLSNYAPLLFAMNTVFSTSLLSSVNGLSKELIRAYEKLRADPAWDYPIHEDIIRIKNFKANRVAGAGP